MNGLLLQARIPTRWFYKNQRVGWVQNKCCTQNHGKAIRHVYGWELSLIFQSLHNLVFNL